MAKKPVGEFEVETESTNYPEIAAKGKTVKSTKHVTDDYDAKDHLNTLAQAHAIMTDPKKMAKVKKLTKFHKHSIRSLDDVKAYQQKAYGPKGKGPMPVDNGDGDEE